MSGHKPAPSVCCFHAGGRQLERWPEERLNPLPNPCLFLWSSALGCGALCACPAAHLSSEPLPETELQTSDPRAGVRSTESGRAGLRPRGLALLPGLLPQSQAGLRLSPLGSALRVRLAGSVGPDSVLPCNQAKSWAFPFPTLRPATLHLIPALIATTSGHCAHIGASPSPILQMHQLDQRGHVTWLGCTARLSTSCSSSPERFFP